MAIKERLISKFGICSWLDTADYSTSIVTSKHFKFFSTTIWMFSSRLHLWWWQRKCTFGILALVRNWNKLATLPPPSHLRHSKLVSITVIGAFVKVTKLMATQSLQWAPLYSLFGQLISPVGQSSTKTWNGYSWLTIYFQYLHRHLYDLRRGFRLRSGYIFKVTNPMELKEIEMSNISGLDTDGYSTCPSTVRP